MIVVKIIGGLGNQMFQYATGKALAEKNKTVLKLDISAFQSYGLRNFELGKLVKDLLFATDLEINSLKATNKLRRIKERVKTYPHKHFYKEPYFHYDPNFFKLSDDTYIQGYFQSEKYFIPVSEQLRSIFSLHQFMSREVLDYGAKFKEQNTVAIHVRKGDYKNTEAVKVHGILPTSYYKGAVAHIKERLTDVRLLLFSDDPYHAKNELSLNDSDVISGRMTTTHFEDLYLMSQCKHNIIANSSFSWWGAWLNFNPEKIVIAPQKWFNNGPQDTQDLIPKDWIRL